MSPNFSLNEKYFRHNDLKELKAARVLRSINLFRKLCCLWDNVDKYGRDGGAIDDNVAHARCMLDNKCTDTYSKYVILIAFPRQQCLRERVRMLRYTTVPILLILLESFVGLPDRMQFRSNGSTVSSARTFVPLTQKKKKITLRLVGARCSYKAKFLIGVLVVTWFQWPVWRHIAGSDTISSISAVTFITRFSPNLNYLLSYLLIYLLTYSTKRSPSWEVNRFSASQEIPCIYWNPKVHYRSHKCPPTAPILSSIHSMPPPPTSWRSILILSSHLRLGYPKWRLSLRFPHQNPI